MYKINVKLANILNNGIKELIKEKNMTFLTEYQLKILRYVNSDAFAARKLLLLFMDVGTGKSLTSLSCACTLLAAEKYKRIVILSPKSIQEEFLKQFDKFCKYIDIEHKDVSNFKNFKLLRSKIITMCYNSPKTYEYFSALKHYDDTIYIVDEAHLFMRSIMKVNIPDEKAEQIAGIRPGADFDDVNKGQCLKVFEEFKKLKNSCFLFLTGTPCAKTPFELVPIFNLTGTGFPETVDGFMNKYFKDTNVINKTELKTKLKGLVAHIAADNKLQKLKASPLNVIDVEMSIYQYSKYIEHLQAEFKEHGHITHINKFGWGFGQVSSFHAKTFSDSIYVPPENDDGSGKQVINEKHAPKVIQMFKDAEKVHGKCCYYFRFVDKGVNTMRQCLEDNGYTLASTRLEDNFESKGKRYIVFTGGESVKTKYNYLRSFNRHENNYGEYIKYIILSPAGSVGINLGAVRFLGIGSVEYNYSMIRQIMGRCNRLGSHLGLPEKDRTLINNLYIASTNKCYIKGHKKELSEWYKRTAPNWDEEFPSIERCIYQDSILDDEVNENFRDVLREVSIV